MEYLHKRLSINVHWNYYQANIQCQSEDMFHKVHLGYFKLWTMSGVHFAILNSKRRTFSSTMKSSVKFMLKGFGTPSVVLMKLDGWVYSEWREERCREKGKQPSYLSKPNQHPPGQASFPCSNRVLHPPHIFFFCLFKIFPPHCLFCILIGLEITPISSHKQTHTK